MCKNPRSIIKAFFKKPHCPETTVPALVYSLPASVHIWAYICIFQFTWHNTSPGLQSWDLCHAALREWAWGITSFHSRCSKREASLGLLGQDFTKIVQSVLTMISSLFQQSPILNQWFSGGSQGQSYFHNNSKM